MTGRWCIYRSPQCTPLIYTQVEGYLRNEHELILVGCIEEARRDTVEAFESSFDKSLLLDWEQTKRSVFESLTQQQGVAVANANAEELQRSAYDRSSVSATGSLFPMRKSMLGTTTAAVGHAQPVSADHLQMYAQVVADINDVRLQERSVQVVSLFEDIARKQDSAAVSRSWELLAFVLGERVDGVRREAQNNGPSTPSTKGTLAATSRLYPTAKPIGGGAFRQREFAKTYLGAASGDKEAVALREHFIAGGRKWLESLYVWERGREGTSVFLLSPCTPLSYTASVSISTTMSVASSAHANRTPSSNKRLTAWRK